MRETSIETEISPKAKEKDTAPTGLQSVYGQKKVPNFKKKKNVKVKPMHKHFIHAQSYIT